MPNALAKKETAANPLLERFTQLKAENPSVRPKDAADQLNVSEGELVAARINGETIYRLENKPEEIIKNIHKLGEVMALTRNDLCVHERKGVYDNVSFFEEGIRMGLIANPDIDLRLFMSHWAHAFVVTEGTKAGPKKSIQFYGKDGLALHKIYLTPESSEAAFDELVKNFRSIDQSTSMAVEKLPEKRPDMPDDQVNAKAFESELSQMQDTHDFYMLLRKHRIGRTQSYRLISDEHAYSVTNDSARKILEAARDTNCEIMVFVGNRGCLQIHTGPVSKLVEHGEFYNVLDAKFNLHLNDKKIKTSWVVKKPTKDGIVTSLELFDENEELIVTFFGKRKPGSPELQQWRDIVSNLK